MGFSFRRLPPREPFGSDGGIQRIGEPRIKATAHMAAAKIPEISPHNVKELIEEIKEIIQTTKTHAPFISHLKKSVFVEWLDPSEGDLGRTTFSLSSTEMVRRKRNLLSPGKVKIELHPVLLEDHKLYRRTLAHELLHAAGLVEHSEEHDTLTDKIQRSPKISESKLLQTLKSESKSNIGLERKKPGRRCLSCKEIQKTARPRCTNCGEAIS